MLGVLLETWSLGGGDFAIIDWWGVKVHYYVHTLSISRYLLYIRRTRIVDEDERPYQPFVMITQSSKAKLATLGGYTT